jgi:hypothetical protein
MIGKLEPLIELEKQWHDWRQNFKMNGVIEVEL